MTTELRLVRGFRHNTYLFLFYGVEIPSIV